MYSSVEKRKSKRYQHNVLLYYPNTSEHEYIRDLSETGLSFLTNNEEFPRLLDACAGSGIQLKDLSMIIPHQANQRIIDAVRKRIKIPDEKIFSNIRHIGNTSSSSIPLCLEQLLQERTSG